MIKINSRDLTSIINGSTLTSQDQESDLTIIHQLLNRAIQIEHFTIPLYLTAYYSIPDKIKTPENKGFKLISDSLFHIYVDEMHHMKWACNLLAAYHGTPKVHCKENMPDYPNGPSILHIENEFPLSKASIEQIKKFVEIERPDFDPLEINERIKSSNFSSLQLIQTFIHPNTYPQDIEQFYKNTYTSLIEQLGENTHAKIITYLIHVATELIKFDSVVAELLIKVIISSDSTLTIGQFYQIVKFYISLHGQRNPTFEFNTQRQIVKKGEEVLVKTVENALTVIDNIVEQGEGTSSTPVAEKELAHYYKFNEIVHRKKGIIKDGKVSYEGAAIEYDEKLLYPFSEKLKLDDFPEASPEYKSLKNFNDHYNEMLQIIEKAFVDGEELLIKESIQKMRCLSAITKGIVTLTNPNNQQENLRPVFEYSTNS